MVQIVSIKTVHKQLFHSVNVMGMLTFLINPLFIVNGVVFILS